jgi:hypothetical protein
MEFRAVPPPLVQQFVDAVSCHLQLVYRSPKGAKPMQELLENEKLLDAIATAQAGGHQADAVAYVLNPR